MKSEKNLLIKKIEKLNRTECGTDVCFKRLKICGNCHMAAVSLEDVIRLIKGAKI